MRRVAIGMGGAYMSGSLCVSTAAVAGLEGTTRRFGTVRVRGAMPFTSFSWPSDTYRAAAVEQLDRWAQRIGAEIVKGKPGGDPAAVAYDACQAALSRNKDVAVVDTAGRLHTQIDLMRELEKIHRVIGKAIPGAPHEVLLVLDATNGQNAILQAANFTKAVK